MVYNNVTYFAMTVYPRIYLARWSYAPAPGRYPATPALRHIDVLTPCNHSRKTWRKKTLHNYFIHRHINPVYGLLNVPKRSTILASLTHMHWKKPIHYALQTAPIRRWCHQQGRKSPFFIVATLWPCLNNGLHECDVFRNDGLPIDTIDPWESTPIIPWPYPTTPAWRHIVVVTHRNHSTKKMGVKMHRTPSCVHLKWKYNIRLPPKKCPSRAKATRLQVVNMLGWIW